MMKRKSKKTLFIAIMVVLIIALGWTSFQVAGKKAKKQLGDFKPDISVLNDGTYQGEYKAFGFVTAAHLEFSIKAGNLESFTLKKVMETPGHEAAENIEITIQNTKNLDFDAISGATLTTAFIKAGIKNAFEERKSD